MGTGKDRPPGLHRLVHSCKLFGDGLVAQTKGLSIALKGVEQGDGVVRRGDDIADRGIAGDRLAGEGIKQIRADAALVGDHPGQAGGGAEDRVDRSFQTGTDGGEFLNNLAAGIAQSALPIQAGCLEADQEGRS